MKQLLIILLSLLLLQNCEKQVKTDVTSSDISSLEVHPGKQLLESNCTVCHSQSANHDTRLAPPMMAVKNHYLKNDVSKEEFIQSIQNWIKDPSDDNAKMRGAVKRFEVMPKQPFPEKTIELIADYMYTSELEKPNCSKGQNGKHKGDL